MQSEAAVKHASPDATQCDYEHHTKMEAGTNTHLIYVNMIEEEMRMHWRRYVGWLGLQFAIVFVLFFFFKWNNPSFAYLFVNLIFAAGYFGLGFAACSTFLLFEKIYVAEQYAYHSMV